MVNVFNLKMTIILVFTKYIQRMEEERLAAIERERDMLTGNERIQKKGEGGR